ncbi:3-deoxy-D-manno-octulosonic acid transferase [Rhodospirillum rubrum]|uniref:3-deoxy-D-manno-octulosonic acid transferase n=2 Tax=Rhodospirillum rubrum TaxID=1085 RepID=UPI001907D6D3|nr:3-deoxy-D-manno-octulosonic acid transferase [Rhodospirillum rubrum]MBK1675313.1 3-deoxy-D-manno-octulosonic acid transferase [Rhodospirillum rubrum]
MSLYSFYRFLTVLGGPGIDLLLRYRRSRGKEDADRLGERLGEPGLARPVGPLVWLHGASVGEAKALVPLIARLRAERPRLGVLLTTGTVTSARVVGDHLPRGAIHQYLPVDKPGAVRRFLDHWTPDLMLWSESDFWPNLMVEAGARQIPMVLLNGRVSDRSYDSWRRHRRLIGRMLDGFALCLGQTEEDARRLADLGAAHTGCVGNLKFANPADPAEPRALAAALAALDDRPRWIAASTHPGEEVIAGRLHKSLKAKHPGLLTIVVPRHPHRAAEVAAELTALGLSVRRRSEGWPATTDDVLLGDTMGEMGLYLRLAPVVFMGKTLAKAGGQNPLEPALLESAVLWGPGMTNFGEIAARMQAVGAALTVADEAELGEKVSLLLTDAVARRRMARAARLWAEGERAVLDRVFGCLAPFLDALTPLAPTPSLREAGGARP